MANFDLPPGLAYFLNQLRGLLFAPGSHFSLTSLGCALVIAVVFVAWQRHRRGRPIRPRAILRALFPRLNRDPGRSSPPKKKSDPRSLHSVIPNQREGCFSFDSTTS